LSKAAVIGYRGLLIERNIPLKGLSKEYFDSPLTTTGKKNMDWRAK